MGSSGIQVSLKTDLVTEGFRPGKVIRIRPESWPLLEIPGKNTFTTRHRKAFPNSGYLSRKLILWNPSF